MVKKKQANKKKNMFVWLGILLVVIIIFLLIIALKRGPTGYVVDQNSPSICRGGTSSGGWSYCERASADDTSRAYATVRSGFSTWRNYNFSIPSSASIDQVMVRADFFASNPLGYIDVAVSGDGGLTYGPYHRVGGNTAEQSFFIDVTNDLAWTPEKLNNVSLRVFAVCRKGGLGGNPTCYLDWLPVLVNHSLFDFSVSVFPGSGGVVQGESVNATTTVNLLGGISQPVSLSSSGCPTGAVCSFSPSSGNPTYISTFTVVTDASTPAGTYPIALTGTGGGLTRTTTYTLTVNAAAAPACKRANPTVSVVPATKSGTAGTPLNYNVTVTNQDSSSCAASAFNLSSQIPAGWTRSFGAYRLIDISPGSSKSTNLTVTSLSSAVVGNYTFNVTALNEASPSFKGTGSAVYQVVSTPPAFNFSLAASPSSESVTRGGSNSTTITATLLNGATQSVSLSVSGCPSGTTCTIFPGSGNPTFSSTLNVSTSTSTPTGSHTITVTGTGGGLTRTTTYTLTVNAAAAPATFDFSISTSPTSGSAVRGTRVTTLVNVTLLSGTTQRVNLSYQGCPPNSTCVFNQAFGNPSFATRFNVTTNETRTPTGTYVINITGVDGGFTRRMNFTVTIT